MNRVSLGMYQLHVDGKIDSSAFKIEVHCFKIATTITVISFGPAISYYLIDLLNSIQWMEERNEDKMYIHVGARLYVTLKDLYNIVDRVTLVNKLELHYN